MSAMDPLKRKAATAMRVVAGDAAENDGEPRGEAVEVLRCSYRPPNADFYCWKYGVWYNLMDCCLRHDERTYEGCGDCGQGRNNLRANQERYRLSQRRQSNFGPRNVP
jgi:hypothetical protein